jgi:hypothetical protein
LIQKYPKDVWTKFRQAEECEVMALEIDDGGL